MARERKSGGRPGEGWLYLGASGMLQPLSTEFLYRSPAQSLRRCRSCRFVTDKERSHGLD
jgi:hypothetical protein